jgi:amino acid adenylation domain-containing protein
VLEEAPARVPLPDSAEPEILPLSARTSDALAEAMSAMVRHLDDTPDLRLADVSHTLQVGRVSFRERAVVVAESLDETREVLSIRDRSRVVSGRAQGVDGCVFLFPGGGAQYVGMGRGLYDALPEFRAEVDEGLRLLEEREGLDLRPLWLEATDPGSVADAFQRPSVQLPALFILEMALARQLIRWGFQPTALLGHSMGENTAACLAGVLEYGDALGLVALRGRLFDTAAPGGMLSVTASSEVLAPYLGPELDMAAINGPEQCTVSGPREPLAALAMRLEEAGIDARTVPIDIAAHSSLVDPLMAPFEEYLRGVTLRPPEIPFLSNRSGSWITDEEATDPAYWARHLRGTVRFADDVRTALEGGSPFFLEVGPGKILSSLVKLTDPAVAPRVSATMRHPSEEVSDLRALMTAVARIWTAGGEVDWGRIRGEMEVRRVALPGYPFQRRPFLVAPASSSVGDAGAGGRGVGYHESGAAADLPAGAAAEDGVTAPPPAAQAGAGVSGVDGAALRRVLELQIQTNAAVQSLLTSAIVARTLGSTPPAPPREVSASAATGPAATPVTTPAPDSPTTGEAAASGAEAADGAPMPEVESASAPSGRGPAALGSQAVPASSASEAPAASTQDGPAPSPEAVRTFWQDALRGPLPVLEWMTDELRLPGRLRERGVVSLPLLPSIHAGVRRVATVQGVPDEAVILAAYSAVLHKQTGQDSFVVGTTTPPDSGVGGGAGTLPLRIDVLPDESFEVLVRRIAEGLRQVLRHRGLPVADLVAIADVPPDPTRAPVLQTRLASGGKGSDGGVPWTGDVPLDLDVGWGEAEGGPGLSIDYAAGLYRQDSVEDLGRHIEALLGEAVRSPDSLISALPAVGPGVLERIEAWNDSSVPVPEVDSLAGWLSAGWAARREQVALVAEDGELTYGALAERSDRLAQHLVASGVTPGSLVGLCLRRTSDLLVATIAVWKAGAGYVPLDPTYPPARLALMARRAELSVVVTAEELGDLVPEYDGPRVLVDRDAGAIATRPAVPPTVEHDLADAAYVLFTSGSTGEPKGVRVPASCVVNLLEAMARRPGFGEGDCLLAVTTLSFDISVLELFLPLLVGGRVVLATAEDAMDGPALVGLLDRYEVTLLQSTPSTFRLLLSAGWEGREDLRIICCGEPFPRDLLRELLPRVSEVWNGYGPTEATVFASFARLTDADAPIVIGRPVENTRLYVLDEDGGPVGPGVQGELYIAGLGVADGYVGRPEETAARFLTDPFGPPGSRMYRTGDAVRWRRDGELEHLARMDQQVKVRGFRIELGEIEATLASCDGVRGAAVVLRDEDGVPELLGYVATDQDAWSERALREKVGERLPAYMIPRFLVRLDALPLTENGKVDRKRLPDPRDGAGWTVRAGTPSDEPVGEVGEGELYLRGVWEEILEVPDIRSDDNFFDLGGHSLLAVRTIARIREERGVDISLRALMAGTLGAVAREYLAGGGEVGSARGGRSLGSDADEDEDEGAVSRVLGTMKGWMSR